MPPTLSAHARRLAVVLEVLALLALVSGAFPLAIASPIWWLRLGEALVNLAPMVLLAVILLRFASFTLKPNADQDRRAVEEQPVDQIGGQESGGGPGPAFDHQPVDTRQIGDRMGGGNGHPSGLGRARQ